MPTPEENENLFAQFLDDYFAECDEHLTDIRENILAIESFVNQPKVERSLLDKLFGSFHSLKGLSGMVGLKEAEQIAHEMESYLRSLRQEQVILTQPGIDALIAGIKILEQVINNYRIQAPIPDILPAIEQLKAALSTNYPSEKSKAETASPPDPVPPIAGASQPPSPVSGLPPLNLKPEEKTRIIAAIESGARPWQCQFIPAPEKAKSGINVNSIRQRLQSIGELVHASPRVTENGGIVFDFVVTSHADAATFNDWAKDGLTITPYLLEKLEEEKAIEEHTRKEELAIEGEFLHSNEPKISKLTQSATANSLSTSSNVVRVDLLRLDELMRMVGELVITRARLDDNLKSLKNTIPAAGLRTLRENTLTLERQLRDLREGVMRVRLVPIGEIFARMQFVIRDLAKETQKQVLLELSGQTTEIDKFIVERMIDPLLHLVRNAVSHGLEAEAERVAKGKPKEGKIFLRAYTAGEMVVIEVEDDGRGVDIEKVTNLAKQQGGKDPIASRLINSADITFDPTTVLDIICSSGFSTKEQADKISGRGVGMAVVKNAVQELSGFLTLNTAPGKGTKFTIQLPLTLSIADALVVSVSGQTFVIPLSSVREVMQVKMSDITYLENNEIIAYRNNVLPLIRLRKIFNLSPQNDQSESEIVEEILSQNPRSRAGGEERAAFPLWNQGKSRIPRQDPGNEPKYSTLRLVVVGNGLSAAGIPVDRILGQQEIVVRPLTDPLVQVTGIAGATELGNGKVVLIIDPIALTRMVMKNY